MEQLPQEEGLLVCRTRTDAPFDGLGLALVSQALSESFHCVMWSYLNYLCFWEITPRKVVCFYANSKDE